MKSISKLLIFAFFLFLAWRHLPEFGYASFFRGWYFHWRAGLRGLPGDWLWIWGGLMVIFLWSGYEILTAGRR